MVKESPIEKQTISYDDISSIYNLETCVHHPPTVDNNSDNSPPNSHVLSDNNNIVAMQVSTPSINSNTSTNTQTSAVSSESVLVTKKAGPENFFTVEKVQEAIENAIKKQTNDIKKFWQADN